MAVCRAELHVEEMEALVALLAGQRLKKSDTLWRARRELKRSLAAGHESQQRERENMERIRRNRRPLPDWDDTLTPHTRRAAS